MNPPVVAMIRRRRVWAGVGVAFALAAAGWITRSDGRASRSLPRPRGFAWLHPEGRPEGWRVARTPSGTTLAYPPGWRQIPTDAGTLSAAPAGEQGVFSGYLNVTPRSGSEVLSNWRRFRLTHLMAEGARRVHLESAATDLPFLAATGSCVIDTYVTPKAAFREIACLVAGRSATTVVVAAAPTAEWPDKAAALERAVAGFTP
jgi:hypothetical protein